MHSRIFLKRTFASPLLKQRREGGEIKDEYTGNCKFFRYTQTQKEEERSWSYLKHLSHTDKQKIMWL